jgi:tetratricopeptide (TPR) repeat protein
MTKWAVRLGIPLLAMVVYRTQFSIDRQIVGDQGNKEVLYLTSGNVLQKMSLGHTGLLADIYWMRAVQYYGGKRLKNDSYFPLLKPLLDITTTLDPQLFHAYRFGSIFLSEPAPVGANQPDAAIDLLSRGIANNPNEWQLYRDLGFVYYWYLQDYQKAAQAFLDGSKNPTAAIWMRTFAAELLSKGNNRRSARFLWQEVYETSENRQIKENAREHLFRLSAEEDIETLQVLVQKVESRLGRKLISLDELLKMGFFDKVPVDPKGFTYVLDPVTGKVELSPISPISRY